MNSMKMMFSGLLSKQEQPRCTTPPAKFYPTEYDSRSTSAASDDSSDSDNEFSDCEAFPEEVLTTSPGLVLSMHGAPPGLSFTCAPPGLSDLASPTTPMSLTSDAPPGLSCAIKAASPALPSPWESGSVKPEQPQVSRPPPGLENCRREGYDAADFRRDLVATLRELAVDRNVGKAVRRVRAHGVPVEHQAHEVTDLLTRGAEEFRGPVRRLVFALAVGLATGVSSAFEKRLFLAGLRVFFSEVYPDLCAVAPTFPKIAAAELVPTLHSAFQADTINALMPKGLKAVCSRSSALKDFHKPTSEPGKPNKKIQALLNTKIPAAFDKAAFQKDIVATFRELAWDSDARKAVEQVRAHRVPKESQASETSNLLARAAEERCGPVRRILFAFICGLAAGTPSAFDRESFAAGVRSFFEDAYDDICEEYPRFPGFAAYELVPTLRSVLPHAEVDDMLPASLRQAVAES